MRGELPWPVLYVHMKQMKFHMNFDPVANAFETDGESKIMTTSTRFTSFWVDLVRHP